MPTKRERDYYRMGFLDGQRAARVSPEIMAGEAYRTTSPSTVGFPQSPLSTTRPKKRKLSAWNKYVKANSKKPRFRYRNGKLNLKKMAIAFRKTPAGKKKRR